MHDEQAARLYGGDQAACHDVLFSLDLWTQQLWPRLDSASKVAMRRVCIAMRAQVDERVEVVASPLGFSAGDLKRALLRWPSTRDLTLLNVSSAYVLLPLSTASLARLTSLTVRQVTCMAHGGAWAQRCARH
jgi:hypothetical protein